MEILAVDRLSIRAVYIKQDLIPNPVSYTNSQK
jgi:hypothetical protein